MNKKISIAILTLAAATLLFGQMLYNGYPDFRQTNDGGNPPAGAVRLWANESAQLVATTPAGVDTIIGSGGSFDEAGDFEPTGTWDFSGAAGVTLPEGTTFGAGTTPFNLTSFTDDAAPSAPGTANQFTMYVDRSTGRLNLILNGGSAQPYALQSEVGGGGSTIFRVVNDSTFTCAGSPNPIGEITFTSGQLEVGDVLQFEALMLGSSVAAQTFLASYQWNSDGEPLANQQSYDPTPGDGSHVMGSCYIVSTTSAVCRGFDSNDASGAMDGAPTAETRPLNNITSSSNTLGFNIASCESGSTATVYHHTIRQTR